MQSYKGFVILSEVEGHTSNSIKIGDLLNGAFYVSFDFALDDKFKENFARLCGIIFLDPT
ncbi:hypothetical protein ASF10_04230 [Flavobacterium sp. Leaf82]|nr:hypothetical protein ASF10_04230 [Flavobacterium sp. Leaf82]